MRFVSVEDMALKIWECESGVLKTVKKLNLKQKIIDAVTSDMIGFIIVLGQSGSILILNSDGKFVSTIERPEVEFTSISCSNEQLYLGTFSGQVMNYHLSSLNLVREITQGRSRNTSKVTEVHCAANGK